MQQASPRAQHARLPTIGLAAALLAGCAVAPPEPQQVRYVCDEGRHFTVVYDPSGQSAEIELRQMSFPLRREPSLAGARYACEALTLDRLGPDAVLVMSGSREYTNCKAVTSD